MKQLNTLIIPIISLLIAIGAIIYVNVKIPRTAFINTGEIYNQFDLKVELEKELTTVQNLKKGNLDSLGLKIEAMTRNPKLNTTEKSNLEQLQREYFVKEQRFSEDNEVLREEYQGKIWTQLNQYLQDYTKDEGYDYLFGVMGTGNILGAAEKNNITEEVLRYVNKRYKGKKQ